MRAFGAQLGLHNIGPRWLDEGTTLNTGKGPTHIHHSSRKDPRWLFPCPTCVFVEGWSVKYGPYKGNTTVRQKC